MTMKNFPNTDFSPRGLLKVARSRAEDVRDEADRVCNEDLSDLCIAIFVLIDAVEKKFEEIDSVQRAHD